MSPALEHRVVLYDAIGFGPHLCRYCGRHVNWQLPGVDALVVDHINNDPYDNRPENLAESCRPCNSRKGNQCVQ